MLVSYPYLFIIL